MYYNIENICGDYGLTVEGTGVKSLLSNEIDICLENKTYTMKMQRRSGFQINLSFMESSPFYIKCMIWCTPDGALPPPPPNPSEFDDTVMQALVRI